MTVGEFIPWLRSPVAVSTVGAIILQLGALAGMLGFETPFVDDPAKVDAILTVLFQALAGVLGLVALWTRAKSPIQPLALSAKSAAAKNAASSGEAGHARVSLLAGMTLALVGGLMVAGCAGTKAAYKAAGSPDVVAYVVAEHYSALVSEAASLAAKPGTAPEVVSALRVADNRAAPVVLELRGLRDAYLAAKSAESEAALQSALDRAVRAVADMVEALKAARRASGGA